MVYLKPKQLIIKDCAGRFVLKLYRHEASRGLFATAELPVLIYLKSNITISCRASDDASSETENHENLKSGTQNRGFPVFGGFHADWWLFNTTRKIRGNFAGMFVPT